MSDRAIAFCLFLASMLSSCMGAGPRASTHAAPAIEVSASGR